MHDGPGMDRILQVIDTLLGPEGCPWDRKQTPESLCDYLVEETFELAAAIRSNDAAEIREEMGDVLFLLLFMIRLLRDKLSLDDVLIQSALKMTGRHPHVFGSEEIGSRDELTQSWERIKKKEKTLTSRHVLDTIPKSLPPLLQAYRMNSKAASVGFTWPDDQGLEEKLEEEWQEWLKACSQGNPAKMEEELGDYLFTLVEYARRHQIKANSALAGANAKFARRMRIMEGLARERGRDISNLDQEDLDSLWLKAKAMDGQ